MIDTCIDALIDFIADLYKLHSGLRPSLVFKANKFQMLCRLYLNTVKCNDDDVVQYDGS